MPAGTKDDIQPAIDSEAGCSAAVGNHGIVC